MQLENHMVLNGGSNGPDWDYDEDADVPEITQEQALAAYVEQLESDCKMLQGRINNLMGGIRGFLWALDRGYFGGDLKSVDLSDTEFLNALRGLAAKQWAGGK